MNYLKKFIALIITYIVFVGMTWEPNVKLWSSGIQFLFYLFELAILYTIIIELVNDNGIESTDNQDNQGQ